MKFSDIVGYQDLKDKLLSGYHAQRLHHAQLFLDRPGGPALALSLAFTQYIFCEEKSESDSCGRCESCLKNQKLIHPDVHFVFPFYINKEKGYTDLNAFLSKWRQALLSNPYMDDVDWIANIDGENKQAKITAAECQSIVHRVNMKSFEGRAKVFVIWMPEEAEKEINIILKSLEEPPADTYFFLINFNKDYLLNTIISRCQSWRMRTMNEEEVVTLCTAEGMPQVDAMQVLQQVEPIYNEVSRFAANHTVLNQDAETWLKQCLQNQMPQVLQTMDDFSKKNREEQKVFYKIAMNILSKWIVDEKLYRNFVGEKLQFEEEKLFAVFKELEKAFYHTERNANAKMQYLSTSISIKRVLS